MQQIKVKKLPVDWFITGTYYPSGNVEFVSEKNTYSDKDIQDDEQLAQDYEKEYPGEVALRLRNNPKETYGTKHIQLIGANNEIVKNIDASKFNSFVNYDGYIKVSEYDTKFSPGCSGWLNIDKNTYNYAEPIINKGTDYFIYKVTEEK